MLKYCIILSYIFLFSFNVVHALVAQPKPRFSPFSDITVNATWTDPKFPKGLPNKYYGDAAIQYGVDTLYFAFITLAGNNTPGWGGQGSMPIDWAKPLSDELFVAGVNVAVSFGGANGEDISSKLSIDELVKAYETVIKVLNCNHIDFDIENQFFNPNTSFPAIASIQARNPNLKVSLTLPVMPDGLQDKDFKFVLYAHEFKLKFQVNLMAMDYGPAYQDMGLRAVTAVEGTKKRLATVYPDLPEYQLYQMIGIIPMIGQNDNPVEVFTFNDVAVLSKFAKQKGIEVSMWSLTRDAPGPPGPTSSGFPPQKYSFEFSSLFVKALGIPSHAPITTAPTHPTPVPTIPDWKKCTKVIAIPNNPQGATDADCAPCKNGQKWWPCNVIGLCKCIRN